MNKFVIYTRVSTADQADKGISLDWQVEECRKYVALVDGDIIAEHREIHSAYKKRGGRCRPKLLAAIETCKSEGAILLMAKLSRLGRDTPFNHWVRDKLGEENIVFLDFPNVNKIVFSVMSELYEAESEEKSEFGKVMVASMQEEIRKNGYRYSKRTQKAQKVWGNPNWKAAREKGAQVSGELRIQKRKEELRVVIQEANDMRKRGMSNSDIAYHLNYISERRTRKGNLWTNDSVRRLFL